MREFVLKNTKGREGKVSIFVGLFVFITLMLLPKWIKAIFELKILSGDHTGDLISINYTGLFPEIIFSLLISISLSFLFWVMTKFPNENRDLNEKTIMALNSFKEEISSTFYRGFYNLIGGNTELRNNFANFDSILSQSELKDSFRELVFGYMSESISSIGTSGIVKVDTSIEEYTKFINKALKIPNIIIKATCVVRPYWFVEDEIKDVSLPASKKSSHLVLFKNHKTNPFRLLVLDEIMISELLLSVFVDKNLFLIKKNECSLCTLKRKECPVHRRVSNKIHQIPEIFWFENEVNGKSSNHVDLKYTHINSMYKPNCSEFEDRIFITTEDESMKFDIRFRFTNLSTGLMWLKWGSNAENFPNFENNRISGIHHLLVNNKDHKIYEEFYNSDHDANSLLKSSTIDKLSMKNHLLFLKSLVNQKFQKSLDSIEDAAKKNLFPNNLKIIIESSIDELIDELETKNIINIYKEILDHFRSNGVSNIAFLITYDKGHPEVPVRLACWKENWENLSQI